MKRENIAIYHCGDVSTNPKMFFYLIAFAAHVETKEHKGIGKAS